MFSTIFSVLGKFSNTGLFFFLFLYISLGTLTLRELGVVGEAATLWTSTPTVLSSINPPVESCEESWLDLCKTRPSLSFLSIPLALNLYSGGLFDAPAKLVFKLTDSWRAVQLLNLFWGLCIILMTTRIAFTHINKNRQNLCLTL